MVNYIDPNQTASFFRSGSTLFAQISLSEYYLAASVAQLDPPSDWRPGGSGFNPR